jgi:hypothetical protein
MTTEELQLCTKCNTMKHCTAGVCGRCAPHNEAIEREMEEFRQKFGDSAPRIAMRSWKDCDELEEWLRASYTRLLAEERERVVEVIKEKLPFDTSLEKYKYPNTYKGGFDAAWYLGRRQLYDLLTYLTKQDHE